jgi:hypothetical protein
MRKRGLIAVAITYTIHETAIRYTDLQVVIELVWGAVAERGVPSAEIEVGIEVIGDR